MGAAAEIIRPNLAATLAQKVRLLNRSPSEAVLEFAPFQAMLVRDYMTTKVSFLRDDARLLDAALMIRHSGKRHVPILGQDDKLVGIISDRDVARLAPSMLARMTQEEYNEIFEKTPISVAMTKNPLTISADAPIDEAVFLLHSKKIGALPVVENDKLVGILTISDMLGLLHELLNRKAAAESGG
jgi:acetoin utilization protein AcuB